MQRYTKIFEEIHANHPLIHHITNSVTVNDCANITLCIGASPVMAHAHEEVADMTACANALVLNIGTLDAYQVESMHIAAKSAERHDIPIILDPVGAGATSYRTKVAQELIDTYHITIIKGNIGEIGTLAGAEAKVRGVDAAFFSGQPDQVAMQLAEAKDSIVVITGVMDIIGDANRVVLVENGAIEMGIISGTGCMASSLIGSCAAVSSDFLAGATTALCAFGIAGEHAAMHAQGPISFKTHLFDALANLKSDVFFKEGKIQEG
ncbi:MAG: hydroxyethylthiazole kinase [Methanomicrobiales archaeon]|jgi:hydroxyethylthiazole kinase|nr:hydroxyethylthiazole kinase [Methanomicrobiales archaeon]